MSNSWKEFYQAIKDPAWPDCDNENNFKNLPANVQQECQEVFGYTPGQFLKSDPLPYKTFPIKTQTACQLKWNWSTVYLTQGSTASCHRTHVHKFDVEKFDFHNTPEKINDRERMLQGLWPKKGCEYCRNIEQAGGQSDRITNLDLIGMHAPLELSTQPQATHVTPRILEIYFDNTCDLKCLYCGPKFSSLWVAENLRHGTFTKGSLIIPGEFVKDSNIESNKKKLFDWIKKNGHNLSTLNVLGGEPFYQEEFLQVLDLIREHPMPNLKLQVFSNLNSGHNRVKTIVEKVKFLLDQDLIREFEVTASLDCWGPQQEYVRFPLSLERWQTNFEYLLDQPWINLIINSTVTPLTVKTLPDLLERIQHWQSKRTVYHYQNSVNYPSYMYIDIFGDIFREDFERALALKSTDTIEQQSSKKYLQGIALQSQSREPNISEIQKLYDFLTEMDRRRKTNWREVFPWLVDEFNKHNIVGKTT